MDNDINRLGLLDVPVVEATLLVLLAITLTQVASYAQFVDRCQAEFVGYLRDLSRRAAPSRSSGNLPMTIDGIELKRVPQKTRRFKRRKSAEP